jgi:CO/xanthine dehydrogenase FAD-binding subunit
VFARPGLPEFDYVRASSAGEVVSILEQHGPAAKLMMGGTDLLLALRDGALRARVVVDVKGLPGMQQIGFDDVRGLTVGAAVTMNALATHAVVRDRYPLLAESASAVASYQVRNRATLGGNLCNASPCADTAPAVVVLSGHLLLWGPGGERTVPAEGFFLGPGQTALGPIEFVTGIRIPVPPPGSVGRYLKLGRSRAGDLALVGAAILGFRDASARGGYRFRVGLGSVAPVPLRVAAAEAILADRMPCEASFAAAAQAALEASSPISDVRGGAQYQKAMVRTLVLRGLRDVWERLRSD